MHEMFSTHWRRWAVGAPAAGLLLSSVAACSSFAGTDAGPPGASTVTVVPGAGGGGAGSTGREGNSTVIVEGNGSGTTGSGGGFVVFQMNAVGWPGAATAVTLSGQGATAQIMGTDVQLRSAGGGRAALLVGGRHVDCTTGQHIDAGRFDIRCDRITADSVALTITVN